MNTKFTANEGLVVVPLPLGQAGIDYVRGQMEPTCTLANAVLHQFGVGGQVFALVPEGTSLERALEFDQGGLSVRGGLGNALAQMLADLYGDDCQLIFEDSWFFKEDVDPKRVRTDYFFSANHPYYVPTGKSMEQKVYDGSHAVGSWLCVGYVVKPSFVLGKNGQDMGADEITGIAKNTQAVILLAYDQESFLLWQKG